MKSGLKLVFVTLPLALIGAGFLAYTVLNRQPPEQIPLTERATAVRVILARDQPVTPQVNGFGIVRPARTYEAIAQVAGVAVYVNPALQKGAILPADTVLLRLSPTDFNLAIAQARANIRAAEARLTELEISQKNQAAALEIEKEALTLKSDDLERANTLFANGTVSQSTRDAARAAHLAQRQKLLSVQSTLALLPTQREVQSQQIAVYQASLETASLNLARTKLTLPFAARVATVSVEVGQFVRAGLTTALFDGVDAAEVEAQVSVADLRALLQSAGSSAQALTIDPTAMTRILHDMGLSATVRLRLGKESLDWPATVDRISDTIDRKTGTIGVIVRVNSAYSGAKPGSRPPLTKGMFVEVILNAPRITGLVVPRSALRGGQVLLAGADDRLQQVPVRPHLIQGEIALIKTGLQPGARVIVSTPGSVMTGMLLKVTQDTALMDRLVADGPAE
jgi:multidrug efflux pump subunit AcrA (membrane-fusion protein)